MHMYLNHGKWIVLSDGMMSCLLQPIRCCVCLIFSNDLLLTLFIYCCSYLTVLSLICYLSGLKYKTNILFANTSVVHGLNWQFTSCQSNCSDSTCGFVFCVVYATTFILTLNLCILEDKSGRNYVLWTSTFVLLKTTFNFNWFLACCSLIKSEFSSYLQR